MGVGIGDYDLDGHLDIFKTHFMGDTCGVFRNDGKGNFDDRTRAAKIAVETRFVNWGTGLVDLDNDGYPDIFIVTGSVYPEVERKLPDYPYKTPRIVFRNLGNGTFEELGEEAGPAIRRSSFEPRLRFWRLRQRWRRRHSHYQYERTAIIAAKRPFRQTKLDQNSAGGRQVQSQRHRRASPGSLRKQSSGAGTREPVKLLLLERSSSAFRHRRLQDRRCRHLLAKRSARTNHAAIPANRFVTIREGIGIVNNKGWRR